MTETSSELKLDAIHLTAKCEFEPQAPNRKHPRFFLAADTLSFTVEDTDYSIHSYLLATHAPTWLNELNQAAKPIALHGVRTSEMDALLSILYPSDVRSWGISSVEEWSSVLRLATRWQFHSVQLLAIEHLEGLATPVDKIALARDFDVSTWLLPSLIALCTRPDSLKLDEAERMSLADVVLISSARELIKAGRLHTSSEAVSRHLQQLLTPQPTTSSLQDTTPQETTPTEKISPKSPTISAMVKLSTLAYECGSLTSALNEYDYDQAVAMMASGDCEDIVRQINEWTHSDPGNRGEAAVRNLAWAIIRGSSCNGDFSQSAVRILSGWRRDSPQYSGALYEIIQDASYNGILRAPSDQARCDPASCSGQALYMRRECWLSDADYKRRCRNARRFVAEAARTTMLPLTTVCDKLPTGAGQADILYDCLLSLGPLFSSPGLKESLDQRLTTSNTVVWKRDYAPEIRNNHRLWMQRIYRLRDRDWVPEE